MSVVIPAYDPGPFLAETLDSIVRQDHPALEIILVDDGSSEDLAGALEAAGPTFDARVIKQGHKGPAAARNAGIGAARGGLIAFLDADDLWPEGALQALTACLQRQPQIDVAHGRLRDFHAAVDESGTELRFGPPRLSFNLGSMLFRREVFDSVGLLDEGLLFSEDVDFLVRAEEQGMSRGVVDDVTLLYRRHAHSMTALMGPESRRREHVKSLSRILKRSLERRRIVAADGDIPD